jgi:DnaK suppressor protein
MDPARARELLSFHRERIERELARLGEHDDDGELSHFDQHLADDAQYVHDEELDQGLAERLSEELAAIERAERRLEKGTYGVSVESGVPIPDARLEAVPWAERTAEEQERFDRLRRP